MAAEGDVPGGLALSFSPGQTQEMDTHGGGPAHARRAPVPWELPRLMGKILAQSLEPVHPLRQQWGWQTEESGPKQACQSCQ